MTTTDLQKAPAPANGAAERPARGRGVYFAPRVDIVETPDELILYADLPGVKAGDVSLSRKGDELVLHARCEPRWHGK